MRIVVKIGSNILAGGAGGAVGLNLRRMRSIAQGVTRVIGMGHEVVMVSSGAVAAGMKGLGLNIEKRPAGIMHKQAAAAVGQPALMWAYEKCFSRLGRKVAQVLLTRDGFSNRTMYLNAKNTILTLLSYGVIPIVNENDTVATDEIKFGDNDHLAALVASLVECNRMVILSDVDGLFSEDPRSNPRAKLIAEVQAVTPDILALAGGAGSMVGTGGMYSKLKAAEQAALSGIEVAIINGRRPAHLVSLIEGKRHGTVFTARADRLPARKGWIAYGSRAHGTLVLDDGAVGAITERMRSLLPSGIIAVEGAFSAGAAVFCADRVGNRVAKGLTNYSSEEIRKIMGRRTAEIASALGYKYSDEVIHRDNLAPVADGK